MESLDGPPVVNTGIISIRDQFPRETETAPGPAGAGQSRWVTQIARMDRPRGETGILPYYTVQPITWPLQFPSRLYNTSQLSLAPSLSPLIPSTSRSRSSSFRSPRSPSLLPPFLPVRIISPASLLRHLPITSNAPKVPKIAVSACHLYQDIANPGRLYSYTASSLEGRIQIYL